jgi:RHS repeat-associated protein
VPFTVGSEEVVYYTTDGIGSVRMLTSVGAAVVARYDYLPFGEEWFPSGSSPQPVKFAGKENPETGGGDWQPLNYFGARYFHSATGRFTSVDPVFTITKNIVDPQRWNRYTYVRNNPIRYVDPDGREVKYASDELKDFFGFLSSRSKAVAAILATYNAEGAPTLNISSRALQRSGHKRDLGLFTPNIKPVGDPTITPDRVAAALADGSIFTSATFTEAALELEISLQLKMGTNGRNRDERQAIETALHELGHALSAIDDPLRFWKLNQRDRALSWEKQELEREAEANMRMMMSDFPR